MVSEKLTGSNGSAKPRSVGSESQEPAKGSLVEVARIGRKNLRADLREVVNSRKLQERSIKETEEEIGISEAARKSRLFHAKSRSASRRPRNSCYGPSSSCWLCDLSVA